MSDEKESIFEKHPETEVDYWSAIESLGGFIWRMNHDLGDGRIEDPHGKIDKDIQKMRKVSMQLVEEIGEKFGVIAPEDCPQLTLKQRMADEKPPPAPEGKEYYWDWYNRMKKSTYDAMYENDICSACPYSTGNNGNGVNCKLFPGSQSRLSPEHTGCGMIEELSNWDGSHTFSLLGFLEKVEEEHGKEAHDRFLTKLDALKLMVQKKRNGQ